MSAAGAFAVAAMAATLLTLHAGPVRAWGSQGHQIVAQIAAQKLTPSARASVESLLRDRAPNAMREAANWADDLRDIPGMEVTAPFHYVNFPRGDCRYVARRDCPGGRCVVAALEQHARELRESGDPERRATALRWVIHLVADIHQPLHAAWADDRGGNDLQVQRRGKGTNLHALFDSGLLNERRLRAVPYADLLLAGPAPTAAQTRWNAEAPRRWAVESCALVAQAYPESGRIDDAYADRVRGQLEARLRLAGFRLAALLNASLP
jgi:hypothetical protein